MCTIRLSFLLVFMTFHLYGGMGECGYFVTNQKLHSSSSSYYYYFCNTEEKYRRGLAKLLPVNVFRTISKSTKYDCIFVVGYLKNF